jgi:cytoskeletal protein CcmA (bactofilin family)
VSTQDLTGIGELSALLGPGAELEGKLLFTGRVRVEGKLRGEISSDGVLILANGAEVRADIDVDTLIVRGASVWGNIRASRIVEIYAPSKVYGNITTLQLFLDKGVTFEGSCTMLEAPSSLVHAHGSEEPTSTP